MRIIAAVALLVVAVIAFGRSVYAQCSDVVGCAGQKAEAAARLAEFRRATAVAERAATAEAKQVSDLATAMAFKTQTPTPPSATPQPVTITPSATSQPTVLVIVVTPTALEQQKAIEQPKSNTLSIVPMLAAGALILGIAYWIFRRL